jgi:hypothetical protein
MPNDDLKKTRQKPIELDSTRRNRRAVTTRGPSMPFGSLLFRFLRNRNAGVAPMMALAALPLFGFVGAARTAMQAALDASALMLSKDAQTITSANLAQKATDDFKAMFTRPEAYGGGPYPAPPAENPNYKYTKANILMSDGLNTQNRWTSNQSQIDAREALTCTNAKASGIVIYTVHVNTGGDPTSTVLRNCASSADKFTEIKTANQLLTTFNAIGTALSNLRIAQ